jgi:hypothetical protein
MAFCRIFCQEEPSASGRERMAWLKLIQVSEVKLYEK